MTLMNHSFHIKTYHANREKNTNPDLVEKLDVKNKADLEYRILWIFR